MFFDAFSGRGDGTAAAVGRRYGRGGSDGSAKAVVGHRRAILMRFWDIFVEDNYSTLVLFFRNVIGE